MVGERMKLSMRLMATSFVVAEMSPIARFVTKSGDSYGRML